MQTQGSMATCADTICEQSACALKHNKYAYSLLACPVWPSACCAESPVPTAVASCPQGWLTEASEGCCESKDAFPHADCLAGEIVALWAENAQAYSPWPKGIQKRHKGPRVLPVHIPCQQKYSRAVGSVGRAARLSVPTRQHEGRQLPSSNSYTDECSSSTTLCW